MIEEQVQRSSIASILCMLYGAKQCRTPGFVKLIDGSPMFQQGSDRIDSPKGRKEAQL